MYKRYLIVISVLVILVGCFFIFFNKPTNKELYNQYLEKLEEKKEFDNLVDNNEINVKIDKGFLNNQYHYVITITSNTTLNNFKAMVVSEDIISNNYYPSFGVFDNENINLVNGDPNENETRGVNLVVSSKEKISTFKLFVSYNSYDYYYSLSVGE